MKYKSLLIALAFSMSSPAIANSAPDILTPYQSFKTKLQTGDYGSAAVHAYEAWQIAEAQFGDHTTTKVLAQNYANLHYNVELDHNRVIEAYFRQIELSDTEDEKEKFVNILGNYLHKSGDKKITKQTRIKFRERFSNVEDIFPRGIIRRFNVQGSTINNINATDIRARSFGTVAR